MVWMKGVRFWQVAGFKHFIFLSSQKFVVNIDAKLHELAI
jgi:hypothetical protein